VPQPMNTKVNVPINSATYFFMANLFRLSFPHQKIIICNLLYQLILRLQVNIII